MRRTHKQLEHLRAVPLFHSFTDTELALVDRLVEVTPVKEGEVLVEQGQRGHEFYVVSEGTAEVVRDGRSVAVLRAGDHFGELAVLDPQPRTATVTMQSAGEVMTLAERQFFQLLQDAPTLSRKLLIALARRLHEVDQVPVR